MKRFLAGTLAALMLASAPLTVGAERYGTITREVASNENVSEENRLKQVLTAVKSVIDIPEEYTEFDYDLYTRYGEEQWTFGWGTEDYKKTINVEADNVGNITRYVEYTRNNKSKAPTVFKEDALKTAYAFIENLYPEIIDELELYSDDVSSNTYRFRFRRHVNGLTYDANYVNVYVDYTTGRVKQFAISWEHDAEFDTTDNIVSLEDTVEKWKSDFALDLKYQIYAEYDDDGKFEKATAKLVYLNDSTQYDILAKSGEYLEKSYGWDSAEDFVTEDAADMEFGLADSNTAASDGSVKFSESELDSMAQLEGYISIDEADKIVRGYKQLAIDDSFTLSSYSKGNKYMAYSDNTNPLVVWNLRYTGTVTEGDFNTITARASLDAETGELLSFTAYREYEYFDKNGNFVKPVLKLDDDAAQKLADEFLEEVNPSRYNSLEFSKSTPDYTIDYVASAYGKNDSENDGLYHTALSVNYNRTQNGFTVDGNNARVTVDCVDGKITRYSVSWTEDLEFDTDKALVDFDTARDAYIDNSDKKLEYISYTVYLYDEAADDAPEKDSYYGKYSDIRTRNETRLVYSFNTPFYAVSAIDGKPLDYAAKYYDKGEPTKFDGFNDIESHWAHDKIKLLADIDVLLPAESFNPDEAVTQKEFAVMLMSASNFYTTITVYDDIDAHVGELISYMNDNSLTDEDIVPDAPLMRKDAAKFIMRALGYEKIANIGDIFKTDFIDNDSIDSDYIGYAAIAKALGIINGSDGYFNGDEYITKAESAALIYNYMNAEK